MTMILKQILQPGVTTVPGEPISVGSDVYGWPTVWFRPGAWQTIQSVREGEEFDPIGAYLGMVASSYEGNVYHVFRSDS